MRCGGRRRAGAGNVALRTVAIIGLTRDDRKTAVVIHANALYSSSPVRATVFPVGGSDRNSGALHFKIYKAKYDVGVLPYRAG
jgi:hypothetical protein